MQGVRFKVQVLALLLAGAGLLSCATIAGRAAGKAAPSAVQGSLDTLNSPEGRAALRELMTSPEVQEGVRQLAASLIDGTSSSLTSEERAAQLQKLTALLSQGIASGLIAGADDPANRAKLDRLASEISHSMARAFIDELSHSMTPADREEFAQRVRNIIFEASRELSRGVVAGVTEAIEADQEKRGVAPEDTLQSQIRHLVKHGSRLTSAAAAGLALAVIGLIVGLVYLHLRHRRERDRWQEALGELRARHEDAATRENILKDLKEMLSDPSTRQFLAEELRSRPPPPPPAPPTAH